MDGGREEEATDLVEGFADGDVVGCSERSVRGEALGVEEQGVASTDEEAEEREFRLNG